MTQVSMGYGQTFVERDLPERATVLTGPAPMPGINDVAQAVRDALAAPIAHDPLPQLVGSSSKITIAFDDTAGFTFPETSGWVDFRQTAMTVLLEELEKLGVPRNNITLLCANALHRMPTTAELSTILGSRVAYGSGSNLRCHDAEDPSQLQAIGQTSRGFELEVNRLLVESDQLFYISVPISPFSGGWKSTAVGLSTYRSIRLHHRPWPFAKGHSVYDPKNSAFHKLMHEFGTVIDEVLGAQGRRVFNIEVVNNSAWPPAPIAVFAGHPTEAHERTTEVMLKQMVFPVEKQTDVLIYGAYDGYEGYARFTRVNPILLANMSSATLFGQYQQAPLVRQGGILIVNHPCEPDFDDLYFPSYRELFERVLGHTNDPYEVWDFYADEFANRPEYIHRYRFGHGYHGAHPFFMYCRVAFPRRHLGATFVAGARDPDAVRRLGYIPFQSLDDAIREAENQLGADCSITYHETPPRSIARVGLG